MHKTRVTVSVAGQTLNLCGTEDEALIRKVATYLDGGVNEIAKKHPALSTNMCLLLASLNITEELFALQQKYEELDQRIAELRQLSTPAQKNPQGTGAKKVLKTPVKHPFEQGAPSLPLKS